MSEFFNIFARISDFFSIIAILVSSPGIFISAVKPHLKRDFNKILTFFEIENVKEVGKNYVLGLKKNIIYIEYDKEMVIINPSKWVLLDPKMLIATMEVLSNEYNIQIEITEQYEHNLVLTFSFPNRYFGTK